MGHEGHRHAAKGRRALVERIEMGCLIALGALWCWVSIFDWRGWYGVTAMLLAPPVALAVLVPLRAAFRDLPPTRQPVLFAPTVLVPPLLVYAVWSDFHFLDGRLYDWALLVPAILLLLPIFVGGLGGGFLTIAPLLLLPFMYVDGAVKLLDVELDKAPPTTYRTTVTAKEAVHRWFHRRGGRTDYYVTFAPWGPDRITDEIEVHVYDYDAVKVGGPVCARLHRGYLRLRWYEIEPC